MSNELKLRVGDVVRLKPMKVDAACGETVNLVPLDPKSYKTECVWLDHIESIISRAETPEETIARLEAELASTPRKIKWNGGECPVGSGTWVLAWYKDRDEDPEAYMACQLDWTHDGDPKDIIAYMVLPQ